MNSKIILNRFFGLFLIGVSMVWLLQSQAIFATPLSINKWKPGHYVKLDDWQLNSPSEMADVYDELDNTPDLRGIKVVILWGRYETRTGSVSTYDFSQLTDIADELEARGKHLILSFAWRAFSTDPDVAKYILPNDMWNTNGIYDNGGPLEHTLFDKMYAYTDSSGAVAGYNLKLWKGAVPYRIDLFMQALAGALNSSSVTFDNNNVLVHLSTTESAINSPAVPYGTGTNSTGTEALQYAGQIEVLDSMNARFTNTPIVATLNFTRAHVANMAGGGSSSVLATGKFGLGSPNSHYDTSLNTTSGNPGVLTYYPGFSNVILLAPEVQGDDYVSDHASPPTAYPLYVNIFARLRDDLDANYIVWQRKPPYWKGGNIGGTTIPSVLTFLQSNTDITGDASGAGDLNTTVPSALK